MNTGALILRSAVDDDLPALLDIQKRAFMRYANIWPSERIPPLNETIEELRRDIRCKAVIAALTDGSLAGSVRYSIKGGVCLVERLSVHPDLQNKGTGRALMSEVENRVNGAVHKIYLETGLLADNLLMFYTKLGYSGEAILRKHYGGFDWIVLSKFI